MTVLDRPVWRPGAAVSVAEAFGTLCRQPWLVAGRDDSALEAVRLHERDLQVLVDRLGWTLEVGHGFARLRKSPPVRPSAWARSAPTSLVSSWLFLLVAAADSLAPRVGLNQLVSAARSAAAEAGLPVTGEIHERRAIVAALKELDTRGVITPVDGSWPGDADASSEPGLTEDALGAGGRSTVQLVIHHARLAQVLGRGGPDVDPHEDPRGWLAAARGEPDPSRRVRRRLVDDTCVLHDDLDPQESQWLGARISSRDQEAAAPAFGLALEWRAEGAAYVIPDAAMLRDARHPGVVDGSSTFPSTGTVAHAALLIIDHLAAAGRSGIGPGPGWRTLTADEVLAQLRHLSADRTAGRGGWRADLVAEPGQLRAEVAQLLESVNLLRRQASAELGAGTDQDGDQDDDQDGELWHLAPAAGRWARADSEASEADEVGPRSVDD